MLLVGVGVLALLYVATLPYAPHAPRPPGQRPTEEPRAEGTVPTEEAELRIYRGLEPMAVAGGLEVELLVSSLPERLDHFLVPEAPAANRRGRFSLDLPGLWEAEVGLRWGSVPIEHPLATRARVRPTDDGLHIDIDLAPGAVVRPRIERGDESLRIILEQARP